MVAFLAEGDTAPILKPSSFSSATGASASVLAPSRFQSGNNPWKPQASEDDAATDPRTQLNRGTVYSSSDLIFSSKCVYFSFL